MSEESINSEQLQMLSVDEKMAYAVNALTTVVDELPRYCWLRRNKNGSYFPSGFWGFNISLDYLLRLPSLPWSGNQDNIDEAFRDFRRLADDQFAYTKLRIEGKEPPLPQTEDLVSPGMMIELKKRVATRYPGLKKLLGVPDEPQKEETIDYTKLPGFKIENSEEALRRVQEGQTRLHKELEFARKIAYQAFDIPYTEPTGDTK